MGMRTGERSDPLFVDPLFGLIIRFLACMSFIAIVVVVFFFPKTANPKTNVTTLPQSQPLIPKSDQETTTYKIVVDRNGNVISTEEIKEAKVEPVNEVQDHKEERKNRQEININRPSVNIAVNGSGSSKANLILNGVKSAIVKSNGASVVVE